MRLLDLTIRNFRGFGTSPETINLDGDLLLFFGPTGYGKTSLAEAIEWLFYGSTKRRQRGETYSRTEYAGTYANVHGGQPVEVVARLRLSDGREVSLGRRLSTQWGSERSVTYVDGQQAPFSSIGLMPIEAVYPVVAQHGLQTFIHTRPKDRRDAISAALGLDDLTSLKTALDGACRSFNNAPPPAVTEARGFLRPLATVLATIPETSEMAQRWSKSPIEVAHEEDITALVKAAQALSGSDSAAHGELLAALRTRRIQVARSVFDTTKLAPPLDIDTAAARIERETAAISETLGELAKSVAAAVAATASTYATELLAFWEIGLKLAPESEQCPMCEAPTLTVDRREELRKRLAADQEAIANDKRLVGLADKARGALATLDQATRQGRARGLDNGDVEFLRRLMAGAEESLETFLAVHDDVATHAEALKKACGAVSSYLDTLPDKLADPISAPQTVEESTRLPTELADATTVYMDALKAYSSGWERFERVVSMRIAIHEAVARIDAVGKALRAEGSIWVLAIYDDMLAHSRELTRETEAHLQGKQADLLASRGAEVQTLYDLLNPGAEVGFAGMEPGTEQLKLHATSYGVRMPAAANLSQCQLNCLGLSVWLMRATTPTSPFGFILLDDPVQSMDDDHCEAFMASLVPHLLDDHGKQVILLSHVRDIVDRLRSLHIARAVKVHHYDSYSRHGPTITEQVRLAQRLAEIKSLAAGNQANRELAVDRLRVLVEDFIRELHLHVTGAPAAPQYDNATPAQLLQLFRTIPETKPDEHARLKDTANFADPAHHTEVGYAVPQETNIRPHIDRLHTLMRKYGLIS